MIVHLSLLKSSSTVSSTAVYSKDTAKTSSNRWALFSQSSKPFDSPSHTCCRSAHRFGKTQWSLQRKSLGLPRRRSSSLRWRQASWLPFYPFVVDFGRVEPEVGWGKHVLVLCVGWIAHVIISFVEFIEIKELILIKFIIRTFRKPLVHICKDMFLVSPPNIIIDVPIKLNLFHPLLRMSKFRFLLPQIEVLLNYTC